MPNIVLCTVVKNLPAYAGDKRDAGLILRSGRFPWKRAWQPIPVFLPGLPWTQEPGRIQCKELDMTEFLGAPKSLQMVTAAMKLKDAHSLEEKL